MYPFCHMPAARQKGTLAWLASALSIDGYCRDRQDKAAAPLSNELQLLGDFVFQVPREDHDIVRLGLADPVRMVYRDVTARQKSSLLVRVPIHRVLDRVSPDATII